MEPDQNMPPLPEGFELEAPAPATPTAEASSDLPPLPEGFELETPTPEQGGFMDVRPRDELGVEVIQPGDYINSLDDPEALQRRIDQNKDQRGAGLGNMVPKDDLLKSGSEIYDGIRNDPKYKDLRAYEGSLLHQAGNITLPEWTGLGGTYDLSGAMDPRLEEMKKMREFELQKAYEKVGTEGALGLRTQEIMEPNTAFDPSIPEGPNNPANISKRYTVDPPDREALTRMGYQVFENIVGGGADLMEGKLTTEGTVGSALPDTVPEGGAEKFATEATTFILGPTVLGKMAGEAGKLGVKAAGYGAKAGSLLSPEAMQAARTVYTNVLQKTGDAAKAFAASKSYTKRALVGLGLGVRTGVGEAAIAPDNSDGMIVDPKWLQEKYGWTAERSKDMSVLLDTPIVGSVARSLGAVYNGAKDKVISPMVGGLRNVNVFGAGIGKVIPLSEKQAGMATITWLDPNLVGLAPEDAAFKIKILGDAIENNAVKNAKIAGAGQTIKQDTATAFTGVAEDYYRVAYQNMKDEMGPEAFERWVKDQSTATANRLYELRTSVMGETDVASQQAKGARQIDELFAEGANNLTPNGLVDAQMRAGQTMGTTNLNQGIDAAAALNLAETEAKAARSLADNVIRDDPEFQLFLDQAGSEMGSQRYLEPIMGKLDTKTYGALSKMKKDVDDSYKALSDSGAQGDGNSLLEIIRGEAQPVNTTTGMGALDNDPEAKAMFEKMGGKVRSESAGAEGQEVFIEDPYLRKIAKKIEADDSFGNLYNNVRNDVNKQIRRLEKLDPAHPQLDTLYDLRDNLQNHQLDFLIENGDDDVVRMADKAKQNFQVLRQGWYDNKELGRVADTGMERYNADPAFGSKTPVGPDGRPQKVTDFKIEMSRHINHALEGSEGEHFMDSLTRATKMGGQDISPELSDLYASKAVANLANKIESGQPQSASMLVNSLSGIITPMERLNSPMVPKFKALLEKVKLMDSGAVNAEEQLAKVKEEVKLIQQEAADSIFAKFVYQGKPLNQGETGVQMKKLFQSPKSTSAIQAMIGEADKLGDQGIIIKDAMKGTYLDSIADRLMSKQRMGIAGIEEGAVQNAFKINETNFEKIFAEGSTDMNNLEILYKDQPEIINEIKDTAKTYLNLTKTTPSARDTNFKLPRDMNPEYAVGTLSSLIFGPLSRTGTQVRKLTGPLSADSLEQVKNANRTAMLAMLTDPKEFHRIGERVRKGIIDEKNDRDLQALIRRGLIRSSTTGQQDQKALKAETDELLRK